MSETRDVVLLASALNGDEELLQRMINEGADLESVDQNDRTTLSWTAGTGRVASMRVLIENGASIDQKDRQGNSPLMYACAQGQAEAAELLLTDHADTDIYNWGGDCALSLAVANHHTDIVKSLIDHDVDIEIRTRGDTPLIHAVALADIPIIHVLLDAHAQGNAQDKNGNTALHIGARQGSKETTQVLLEAGVNTTLVNHRGQSAEDVATGEAKVLLVAHREQQILRNVSGVENDDQPRAARRM